LKTVENQVGLTQNMDTRAALPVNTVLSFGEWRIESVIGRGGFGIVYKAISLKTQEVVALKELFPYFSTRANNGYVVTPDQYRTDFEQSIVHFQREASIARQLDFESALKIQWVFLEHGTVYMVMEYVEGFSLEAQLLQTKRLSESEALEILIPTLNVLNELHQHQFLHRDIKPANIMIRQDPKPGFPKVELVDFGSVMRFDTGNRVNVTSRILTPAYAPLEQYGERVMLEPSTDLYALSATMYEAVTGKPPPNALERANGVPLTPVQHLNPGISSKLAFALEKSLEMGLKDRFSSAKEMLLMLPSVVEVTAHVNNSGNASPLLSGHVYTGNSLPVTQNPLPPVISYPVSNAPDWIALSGVFGTIFVFLVMILLLVKPSNSDTFSSTSSKSVNSEFHTDFWLAPIRKKPQVDNVRFGIIGFAKLYNHQAPEINDHLNYFVTFNFDKNDFSLRKYFRKETNLKNWVWQVEDDKNLDFNNEISNKIVSVSNYSYYSTLSNFNEHKKIINKSIYVAEDIVPLDNIGKLYIKKSFNKFVKINWNNIANAKKYYITIHNADPIRDQFDIEFITNNTNFQFDFDVFDPDEKYKISILAMYTDNPGTTQADAAQMRFSESTTEAFTLESLTESPRNIMCQDPC
jgi:serine/threonine protein kinase